VQILSLPADDCQNLDFIHSEASMILEKRLIGFWFCNGFLSLFNGFLWEYVRMSIYKVLSTAIISVCNHKLDWQWYRISYTGIALES
jgi:hypothetical protein